MTTEYGTPSRVGPQQTDSLFHYSFLPFRPKDGGSASTLVRIEAHNSTAADQLARESHLAKEVTAALRKQRSTRPRTLTWYQGFQPAAADGDRPVLVLCTLGDRLRGRFLEPMVQEKPDLLPLDPAQTRQVCVDLFEALGDLHRTGYAHGDVSTSTVLWDGRNAVLARFNTAVADPGGLERHRDIAAAARLLHYAATGIPLNGALPPEAKGELNRKLRGLGDLVSYALAPHDQRIDARQAREAAAGLSVPPPRRTSSVTDATEREDRARKQFQNLRVDHQAIRRARYPDHLPPPPPDPVWIDPPPQRSLWQVLLEEGPGVAARRSLERVKRRDAGPLWLAVAGVVAVVAVLGLLLGRML